MFRNLKKKTKKIQLKNKVKNKIILADLLVFGTKICL